MLEVKTAGCVIIVLIAAATDLRWRKVYNWLTFPAMLLGIGLNSVAEGMPGFWLAAAGLLVGGLLFFPAFFWGGMGAGDIKLMAAIGAFNGWLFVINTAVYTALLGGVAAVIFLLVKGELLSTIVHIGRFLASLVIPGLKLEPLSSKYPFPYAAIIAAGVGCAYWLPSFL